MYKALDGTAKKNQREIAGGLTGFWLNNMKGFYVIRWPDFDLEDFRIFV